MKELKKGGKALLLTVLAYLIQACVMQHLAIGTVTGSMLFTMLAILTVSCGKKYAFCASCLIGMLMESMLSNVAALYVVAYPVITMLCAQYFADMTDRQRERRRMMSQGRRHYRESDLPAHLRIPLCAMLMDLILNIVLCAYLYLTGVDITMLHVGRVLAGVLYTGALAVIVMGPVRYFLGMYPHRRKRDKGGELL